MRNTILVVCGPTASGKTSLAVSMAKRLNSEVISADCMLVYKKLNIGTAKPTAEETEGVRHHLIDVVEPTENFSVSDYEKMALPIIQHLLEQGKVPIVCGGTGFYINSILFKQQFGGIRADCAVREKYEKIAEERGREYLHDLLRQCDAESACKLHYNDVKRVVRALEIFELTGRKKSDQCDNLSPRFRYVAVCYDYTRESLYERINCRVDRMLEQGLVDEVQSLLRSGVADNAQSLQGIGYKEVVETLKNGDSHSTMSDIIKRNTRNYAKRQITFFKKLPGLIYLSPLEQQIEDMIMELLCKQ